MKKNLLFVCSDEVINSFTVEEALKNQTKFSSLVDFDDLFDLSRKLNGVLDEQKIPDPLKYYVNIWDINERKLILRVFGNCYHHYD